MDTKGTIIPKAFKKPKPKPSYGVAKAKMMYMKEIAKNKRKK